MTDKELIAKIRRVRSVRAALQTVAENQQYVGSDPYYRDINDALWEMIDRVLEKSR